MQRPVFLAYLCATNSLKPKSGDRPNKRIRLSPIILIKETSRF